MSGGLVTKGLISGGSGAVPTPIPEQPLPPTPPPPLPVPTGVPTGTVMVMMPSAPNICMMVAENITTNLRRRQAADLVLPSLYKRAYLITSELDEIAVTKT